MPSSVSSSKDLAHTGNHGARWKQNLAHPSDDITVIENYCGAMTPATWPFLPAPPKQHKEHIGSRFQFFFARRSICINLEPQRHYRNLPRLKSNMGSRAQHLENLPRVPKSTETWSFGERKQCQMPRARPSAGQNGQGNSVK